MKKITTFLLSSIFLSKTLASKVLRRVVRITLFLIIFSSFSSYAIAGIQEKQDIPKMVQRADLIIRGKVISTESQWKEDSRGRHIYTSVTVKILDKIKGNIKDDAFVFEVVGGTVDDIREVVSDTPAFEIDEDAIMFLAGYPLTTQQGIDSKIPIYDGSVYRDGLEITVDSFIEALKILEQDPNTPVSFGEKHQALTAGVTAAKCFIYNGLRWFGTSPTVYYKINENTSDCTGEGAAVQRAADTWNNACNVVNFTFQYDGSCSSTGASQNFINCITWGTTSGSVATTYYWYYPSTGEIVECDVVFNDPGYSWSCTCPYSWQMDIETVALHEFGHWLNLADLYDPADSDNVMYGYISTGDVKRWLRSCDIDGICYIYGCAGNCGRPCDECEPEDEYLGTIGTSVWGYSKSGNCSNGGKWVGQFVGEAGATYHFDLCPDSPGSGTANFDADIKITNGSCGLIPGAGEDGVCSSPLWLPNDFQWNCTSSGTYYVIIAPYSSYNSHSCTGDWCDTFTLKYYKETYLPPTPPEAQDGSVTTTVDTPVTVALQATDDGQPDPPAALTYIIKSLPSYTTLSDPGAGLINSVPYTLVGNGNQVQCTPEVAYACPDKFTFVANDYGNPPEGGNSNTATITINVQFSPEVIYETYFNSGLPAGWSIVDGFSDGNTWTSDNPGGRSNGNWTGTFMIVDSDWAGYQGVYTMDEQLITHSIDCSSYQNVTLSFKHYFRYWSSGYDEIGDVDVRINAGSWQNVARYQGADASGLVELDLSSIADDQPNVQIRWHYYNINWEWYWGIDDVQITASIVPEQIPGDFVPDCNVDFDDFDILANQWLQTPGSPSADIAPEVPDGFVDEMDLAAFVDFWLFGL